MTVLPLVLYIALYCKAKKTKREDESSFQKKEWKTTITFFLLFLSVLVVLLPITVLFVLITIVLQAIGRGISAELYVILSLCITGINFVVSK